MWLKSALENHYNIPKKCHTEYKKDKTIDEMLSRIIQSDCAEWYKRKYACSYFHNRYGSTASFNIDFDNNKVDVKIMMKYYTHRSSNIHRLYEYLLVEKEYNTKLDDMFYDVGAFLIDENAIEIIFYYNKDKILNQ